MKLYEIHEAIEAEFSKAALDPESGEIIGVDYLAIEKLNIERAEKIEYLIKKYRTLMHEADAFKKEISDLSDRYRIKSKALTDLEDFLDRLSNGKPGTYGTHAITYRASKALNDGPIESLPDDCVKTNTSVAPIKAEIMKYLKSGLAIDGWEIIERQNIQIK